MKRTVSALFQSSTTANRAMKSLLDAGFDRDAISLVMTTETRRRFYPEDMAAEGAAWGAGVGAIAGALVGLAAAPPIGVVAAGPIAAALGGAALGATGGGVFGALVGLGIPDAQARVYEERIEAGEILVAVETHSDLEAEQARRLMVDADSRAVPHQAVTVTEHAHA